VPRKPKKNPAAVEMGKKGGLAQVPKGFSKMDPKRRAEIARKAAAKRWGKK
jgi:general stress protein YciG